MLSDILPGKLIAKSNPYSLIGYAYLYFTLADMPADHFGRL
jgi:hypothetical protein